MVLLLLLVGLAMTSLTVEAQPTSELFEDVDFSALGTIDERTFVSLNSTYLTYGIAAGALIVLLLAVGLYLYDYYYGTSRSDPVPQDYNQYYTDQEQYNQYLYEQAQYQSRYEYVTTLQSLLIVHKIAKKNCSFFQSTVPMDVLIGTVMLSTVT
jgi:hypothetical protein